jgi:SulP family sulfate permease
MKTSIFPPPLPELGPRPRSTSPVLERVFPFLATFRGYQRGDFRHDFVAGLTTALFAVPQGMAYAMIAGFSPAAGLATTIVASIFGAAFGSSEFLINGPTNAISVMIAGNAALFAAQGDPVRAVVLLTLIIGFVQLVAGTMRLGTLTRFVSESVLTGFTAGAGVYIVVNQLPASFGIAKASLAKDLWGWVPTQCAVFDLARLLRSLHGVSIATTALAALTFVTVRGLQRLEPRIGRRIPAPFVAVVLITLIAWALGLDEPGSAHRIKVVRDIEPLSRTLPSFAWPSFAVPSLRELVPPAFAIGLMGAVEAIAIGKQLANKAGHRFDASRQLIGEGLCNISAALVGGFASSGSFSRTAVNYEAGARTRVSCILSGVLTCLIVIGFAPLANHIPLAALAGTLIHIGLKLVDIARLRGIFRSTTADRMVLLTTFSAVLLAEHLEVALFIGIAVSIFSALRRAEGFKLRVLVEGSDGMLREATEDSEVCDEVSILNLQGELFFAAAEELQAELLRVVTGRARFVVLRMQEAYNLDATSAAAIAHVAVKARETGGRLVLCGVRSGMFGTFKRAGLLKQLGEENVFPAESELLASTRHALAHAHRLVLEQRMADHDSIPEAKPELRFLRDL